jgi:hypothetical protein
MVMIFETLKRLVSGLDLMRVVAIYATIIGAFGGFPAPLKVFATLSQYQVVQWFLVFTLAYQGSADQNIRHAMLLTFIGYLVYTFIRFLEADKGEFSFML